MPYKYKRECPICQRPNVINMSSHLAMVHELSATERSPYLKWAVLCPSEPITRPTLAKHKKHRIYPKQSQNSSIQLKSHRRNTHQSISSEVYEDFRFGHKFSLMVVGPSISGKSFFVKQMLERDHLEYDDPHKLRCIHWFYGQYQDMFKDMRRNMGKDIYFKQGLPEFEPELCDIDPRYNNIVVLDELMEMAVDSPIISNFHPREAKKCQRHTVVTNCISERKVQYQYKLQRSVYGAFQVSSGQEANRNHGG